MSGVEAGLYPRNRPRILFPPDAERASTLSLGGFGLLKAWSVHHSAVYSAPLNQEAARIAARAAESDGRRYFIHPGVHTVPSGCALLRAGYRVCGPNGSCYPRIHGREVYSKSEDFV